MTHQSVKILQRLRASTLGLLLSGVSGFIAFCNALKQIGVPVDALPIVASTARWRWVLIIPLGILCLFILSLRFPRLLALLLRVLVGTAPTPSDLPRLFRGPRPYRSQNGEVLPGRQADIDECWRQLQSESFMILEGESGCGKSSLVHAALLPKAKEKYLVRDVRVAEDPFGKLFCALRQEAFKPLDQAVDERTLIELIIKISQTNEAENTLTGSTKPLLLIIDQFEELFATVRNEGRNSFLLMLKNAIDEGKLRLLIVIRSDYIDLLMSACRELDQEQQALKIGNYYTLRAFNEAQAEAVLDEILTPIKTENLIQEQIIEDFSQALVLELLRPPRDKRLHVSEGKTVLPVELQMIGMIIENMGTENFSPAGLRKLGGKAGLLRIYLEDAKEYVWRKTGESGDTSLLVLKALIPSSEIKQVFTARSIGGSLGIAPARAEKILSAFSERYLVNKLPVEIERNNDDIPSKQCYELMHEHLAQVLSEAPEPILQKARDAEERLRFLSARVAALTPGDGPQRKSFPARLTVSFSQPIKLSEIISLWRFAQRSDLRQMLRNSLLAFSLKFLITVVSILLVLGAWLLRTHSDSYQIQSILADAPVAQAAAARSNSSDFVIDWADALVRSNKPQLVFAMMNQIEDDRLQVEVLLAGGEVSAELGRSDESINFFNQALGKARLIREGSRASAVAAIALALKRVGRVDEADQVFNEALDAARQSTEKEKQGDLALVVRMMIDAGKIEPALDIASHLENEHTRDGVLEDIARAQIMVGDLEASLNTALKINNYSLRSGTLAEVVKELAKKGKIDEALQAIPKIVQDDFRDTALSDLAEGMAEKGMVDNAIKTVRRIGKDDFTPEVLAEVVKARAEAKKFSRFGETLRPSSGDLQTMALIRVAGGLREAGKQEDAKRIFNEVQTAIPQIEDDELRALAHWMLSLFLIEAGDKEAAQKSFDELLAFLRQFKSIGDSRDNENDNALYGYLVLLQLLMSLDNEAEAGKQFTDVLAVVKNNEDEKVRFELFSSMADFLTMVLSSDEMKQALSESQFAASNPDKLKSDDIIMINRMRAMADRALDESLNAAYNLNENRARLNALITVSTLLSRVGKSDKAKQALDSAREIAGNLQADAEVSSALAEVAKGFARLRYFRLARLTCEACSSVDKLSAYTVTLNEYVHPDQKKLNTDKFRHTRIAYPLP